MAAATFARLPELVRCLAEQVRASPRTVAILYVSFYRCSRSRLQTRSRKQLARLCRVSWTFNLAVAPVLFREVCFGTKTLHALADCAQLVHVRLLEVKAEHDHDTSNKILQRMLPCMPLLEGFW